MSDSQPSPHEMQRRTMVQGQLIARGIRDQSVLAAFTAVPREHFVPPAQASRVFADAPLPIGHRQTISQPYIVAYMLEQLQLKPGDRVLEVGAGSGYVCALLSEIVAEVYAIERIGALVRQAHIKLDQLGYNSVQLKHGNGCDGWVEQAPFDAILVSASAAEVPQALMRQLATGGRLLTPVGRIDDVQRLLRIIRTGEGQYVQEWLQGVSFVPLVDSSE